MLFYRGTTSPCSTCNKPTLISVYHAPSAFNTLWVALAPLSPCYGHNRNGGPTTVLLIHHSFTWVHNFAHKSLPHSPPFPPFTLPFRKAAVQELSRYGNTSGLLQK
jgi:hypothetical protein